MRLGWVCSWPSPLQNRQGIDPGEVCIDRQVEKRMRGWVGGVIKQRRIEAEQTNSFQQLAYHPIFRFANIHFVIEPMPVRDSLTCPYDSLTVVFQTSDGDAYLIDCLDIEVPSSCKPPLLVEHTKHKSVYLHQK
jgi:hypothetical protein